MTRWAKEHPIVTNEDKYKEVWGVEPKSASGLYICPPTIMPEDVCVKATATTGEKCTKSFWQSEYKPPKKEDE